MKDNPSEQNEQLQDNDGYVNIVPAIRTFLAMYKAHNNIGRTGLDGIAVLQGICTILFLIITALATVG